MINEIWVWVFFGMRTILVQLVNLLCALVSKNLETNILLYHHSSSPFLVDHSNLTKNIIYKSL